MTSSFISWWNHHSTIFVRRAFFTLTVCFEDKCSFCWACFVLRKFKEKGLKICHPQREQAFLPLSFPHSEPEVRNSELQKRILFLCHVRSLTLLPVWTHCPTPSHSVPASVPGNVQHTPMPRKKCTKITTVSHREPISLSTQIGKVWRDYCWNNSKNRKLLFGRRNYFQRAS